MRGFLPMGVCATLTGLALWAAPASAQVNPPARGTFGAEDGYGGDGFGWGPAYRPETNFRPSYGFYGGVERPYPYGAGQAARRPFPGDVTGSIAPAPRATPARRATVKPVRPQDRSALKTSPAFR